MSEELQWDYPVFKILRKNEAKDAQGNVGGFIIRKEIQKFFPLLNKTLTSIKPTVGVELTAALYFDGNLLGVVKTTYRKQTRKGTRAGENRITGKLMPLLGSAQTGDLMIIRRHRSSATVYRLEVVSRTGTGFGEYSKLIGSRTTGVLDVASPPQSFEAAHQEASIAQQARENSDFELFDKTPVFVLGQFSKLARSDVFRRTVLEHYKSGCVLCNTGMKSPDLSTELDAAHVVPRAYMGVDDSRNGMALCKPHHWAFDQGMWSIGENNEFLISPLVVDMAENQSLVGYSRLESGSPKVVETFVHPLALAWHRENVFRKAKPESGITRAEGDFSE